MLPHTASYTMKKYLFYGSTVALWGEEKLHSKKAIYLNGDMERLISASYNALDFWNSAHLGVCENLL